MPHADPSGKKEVVVTDAATLKRVQSEVNLWDDKHEKYAGQSGVVELVYPNGDCAVSFGDGEWLRMDARVLVGDVTEPQPIAAPEQPVIDENSSDDIFETLKLTHPNGGVDTIGCAFVRPMAAKTGAVVTSVAKYSSAYDSGLTNNTLIMKIDMVDMATPEDVIQALSVGLKIRGYCMVTTAGTDAPFNATDRTKSTEAQAQSAMVVTANMAEHYGSPEKALSEAKASLGKLQTLVESQQNEIKKLERMVVDAAGGRRAPESSKEKPVKEAEKKEEKKKKKKKKKKIEVANELSTKEAVMEAFEKLHHGKRREDAEKELAAMGDPTLEDLEFWDLRASSEDLKPGFDQVGLEVFYFGEMNEAGEPNNFKANMIDRMASFGIKGIVAPAPLKEAGCMYPLIGIPIILPWEQAVLFGNLVFEDFGAPQPEQPTHGEGGGAATGESKGCAQQ